MGLLPDVLHDARHGPPVTSDTRGPVRKPSTEWATEPAARQPSDRAPHETVPDAPALDGLVVGEERAMPVECAAESGHFNAPNPRRRRWPLPTWEEV